MNARSTGFWITTVLFALALGASALGDLVLAPPIVEGLTTLGFPVYLATLLGVWKALGVAAIVAPGLPRLKEWAYAGFFFHLTGAIVAHLAVGDAPGIVPAAGLLALAVTSWALRPSARVLGSILPEPSEARTTATTHATA